MQELTSTHRLYRLGIHLTVTAAIGFSLVLSACVSNSLPPGAGVTPQAPTLSAATETAPALATTEASDQNHTTLDFTGIAQNVAVEVVPAVPESADAPYWQVMPQYSRLTLTGYPIAGHEVKPQIFVYPIKDLAVNAAAGKAAESLQALLQNQQVSESLPFLPLMPSAKQVAHPQVKYLDFKNGKGVRFLTQFVSGMAPINNHELLYTYQGLTSDGKYYVALVLPINLPGLAADESVTNTLPSDLPNNYLKYVADTVNMINQQPASGFTPDLSKLDAMAESLSVQ